MKSKIDQKIINMINASNKINHDEYILLEKFIDIFDKAFIKGGMNE